MTDETNGRDALSRRIWSLGAAAMLCGAALVAWHTWHSLAPPVELASANNTPLPWEPPKPSQMLPVPDVDFGLIASDELLVEQPPVQLTVAELERLKFNFRLTNVPQQRKKVGVYLEIAPFIKPGDKRPKRRSLQQVGAVPSARGEVHLQGLIEAPRTSGEYRIRVLYFKKPLSEQPLHLTVVPMRRVASDK